MAASNMGCCSCRISGCLPWHLFESSRHQGPQEDCLPSQVRRGTAVIADVAYAEQTQGEQRRFYLA